MGYTGKLFGYENTANFMIIHVHSNLSMVKDKILSICLQGNYKDNAGEFSDQ